MLDITFRLNNLCNLQCEYCHWNRYSNFKTDDIKKTLESIFKLFKIKSKDNNTLYFHGGEPSFHPDIIEILKFITHLKQTYKIKLNIEFQTNLSMSKELYKEIAEHVDNFSITLHYVELKKHGLLDQFLDNLTLFDNNYKINNFDIMLEKVDFLNIDRFHNFILDYIMPYAKKANNSEMIYGFCHFKENLKTALLHKEFYHKYNITENTYYWKDSMTKPRTTNELFINGLNSEGCYCDAGFRHLTVNGDGNVFRCGIGMTNWLREKHNIKFSGSYKPITNIKDSLSELIEYMKQRHKCEWNYCGGDFYVKRFKDLKDFDD